MPMGVLDLQKAGVCGIIRKEVFVLRDKLDDLDKNSTLEE